MLLAANGLTSKGARALLTAFALALPRWIPATHAQTAGDFEYTSDGAAVTITDYTGPGGDVTIPNSVTTIGNWAFWNCSGLTSVYFQGNAPIAGFSMFEQAPLAKVYYLPGTLGWGETFAGRPAAVWFLPNPLILTSSPGPGVRNSQFGFTISWATNAAVTVEASADLANPVWTPVATHTLTGGTADFIDPDWAAYPSRFYRLRQAPPQ